jgi:hypothetical protein
VQINSKTLIHCSARSLAVRDSFKSAMTNLKSKNKKLKPLCGRDIQSL